MSLESIPYCDVFYPSEEEFRNFEKFMSKCQKMTKSGIFKVLLLLILQVVPPQGWNPRKDKYKNLEFCIPYPIEQIVTGNSGIYEVFLIQRESRSLTKYKKLVESFDSLTQKKTPLEIEKLFWKTLKLSAPLYGADSPGSIFDQGTQWNLSEIQTILKKGLVNNGIMGVTSPYIYVGAWKTLFAWHKEDMDLFSINYNHLGRPKFWYAVPLEDGNKFEEFMKKSYSEAMKDCQEFLRHKTFLVHPEVLLKNGIKLHKCVQNAGEFVVTLASSYHAGFNAGFNIAEAVNFGLKSWIDLGKKAKSCKCRNDSVSINMEEFALNLKNQNLAQKTVKTSKTNGKIVNNVLQCFDCQKLRKVPKMHLNLLSSNFSCDMLKNLTCDSPEDHIKNYTPIKTTTKQKKLKAKLKIPTIKTKKKQKPKKKKILREILNV